jgi:hypothetical protein
VGKIKGDIRASFEHRPIVFRPIHHANIVHGIEIYLKVPKRPPTLKVKKPLLLPEVEAAMR